MARYNAFRDVNHQLTPSIILLPNSVPRKGNVDGYRGKRFSFVVIEQEPVLWMAFVKASLHRITGTASLTWQVKGGVGVA